MTLTKLPESLRLLFWEYDFDRLDWLTARDLIVRRILTHGDLKHIDWLSGKIGEAGIREWLLHTEGKALSPQQLRYWEMMLDLPRDLVTSWIKSPRRQLWDSRTNP